MKYKTSIKHVSSSEIKILMCGIFSKMFWNNFRSRSWELHSFMLTDFTARDEWCIIKMHKRNKNLGWKKMKMCRETLWELICVRVELTLFIWLHTSGAKWHWSVLSAHQWSSMIWQTAPRLTGNLSMLLPGSRTFGAGIRFRPAQPCRCYRVNKVFTARM